MRKRVFGSIFLTSLVTLLLTTGLLLLAVHAGLTNDMRQRLVTESSYLSAVDNIREELEKGHKGRLSAAFGFAAKYIYVPLTILVLILGYVYNGIG